MTDYNSTIIKTTLEYSTVPSDVHLRSRVHHYMWQVYRAFSQHY